MRGLRARVLPEAVVRDEVTRWWGRVLRPDRATQEEILMVEVMIHGIASLGVPR